MKKLIQMTAAGALLLFASVAGAAQVNKDSFGLNLPDGFGEFTSQAQTVNGKDGKIETTTWISKSPTGEAVLVTVSKMPGKILDPEKMIAGTRDALLKSVGGEMESEEKVAGDVPGAGMMFHNKAAFLRSRLIVDGDRLYQLLYVGRTAEQRTGAPVVQMFDSFRISTPPVAQATPPAH